MRFVIASDIHGSAAACRRLLAAFDKEKADKLLLLGDLLYHGPRNPLPEAYAPQEVAALLNQRKESLLCVKGNCDSEVDQMVLDFPIECSHLWLSTSKRDFFLTHGHVYNMDKPPLLAKGQTLLFGHSHVCGIWEKDGLTFANPGSISLPKNGTAPSYLLYDAEADRLELRPL